MRESAIPAPDSEVPAADGKVMRSGNMTVTAGSGLDQFPEIVTTDPDIFPFLADIFDTGNKDAGSSAVAADNPGLVRDGGDILVRIFPAVITVRAVLRGDEPVTHGR
jgi:hypothetical protein